MKNFKKILNRYYFKKVDLSFGANFSPKKENFWIGQLRLLLHSVKGGVELIMITATWGIPTLVFTIAKVAIVVAGFGYSIWSSSNKKKPRISQESNGHLINSRESSDPIKIVYGVCRVGGTWVFYV